MSRYYAIVIWKGFSEQQVALFKLKSTCKDLGKILSENKKLDISTYVDKILINNAPNISLYKAFKFDGKVNNFSKSPVLYWDYIKEERHRKEELGVLVMDDGDSLEKFDSDDDAKLWFEAIYKL